MKNNELKKLEDKLWDAANSLRAYGGIKASDYAVPVLGLIFLRFADNKYSHTEAVIKTAFTKDTGSRLERPIHQVAIEQCGFYLPEKARYDYLLNLPGDVNIASAIKEAMEAIEQYQDAQFQGVLPKDPYFDIEKKQKDILPQLLKAFSDIPKDATGDVFGKIYEYFLGKFALSEGQKGGEFFTPTSVVRFIVEVIEPFQGKIFDPACGSGGMFVQSANFLQKANQGLDKIYVEGQEFMGETVRLAKMNLLVNNLRGEIYEVNSYEDIDYFGSKGKYDYVMANPPFNVKGIKESTVKNDKRFTHYGLPKPKSNKKGQDKITDANYLWISLFATSLNETGRAGFVMANSASDARNAEYDIRRKMVDSGIVDCMVTIPSNMFYTVTLPATLWFLDKGKIGTERQEKILFIDARNTFRQIDRAHRDWSEEQIQSLAAIVALYRGEKEHYLGLISGYMEKTVDALQDVAEPVAEYLRKHNRLVKALKSYSSESKEKRKAAQKKKLDDSDLAEQLAGLSEMTVSNMPDIGNLLDFDASSHKNKTQLQFAAGLKEVISSYQEIASKLKKEHNRLLQIYKQAGKLLRVKQDKRWSELGLIGADKGLLEAFTSVSFVDEVTEIRGVLDWPEYWFNSMDCLQSRFPDAEYVDVVGLCKVAKREKYAEEQDYSLNAGRYVGIVVEDENLDEEEFKEKLSSLFVSFDALSQQSMELEKEINNSVKGLL